MTSGLAEADALAEAVAAFLAGSASVDRVRHRLVDYRAARDGVPTPASPVESGLERGAGRT